MAQSGEPNFYAKDAFHRYIVNGEACVNPKQVGTKACIHYSYSVPAQESVVMRLRLVDGELPSPLSDVDKVIDPNAGKRLTNSTKPFILPKPRQRRS